MATMTTTRPRFHPHRTYPQRTALLRATSQIPGATAALLRLCPGLIMDRVPCSLEDPHDEHLHGTRLAICGLPRTGTTFLSRAARDYLGSAQQVWKSHDPFMPRDFISRGIPVVITLRPVWDTAISKSIYHGDPISRDALVQRLSLITTWHRLMGQERSHPLMRAWNFETFTVDPQSTLERTLPATVGGRVDPVAVVAAVSATDDHEHISASQAHTPSQDRRALRARYETYAADSKIQRHLAIAVEAQERVRQNHAA